MMPVPKQYRSSLNMDDILMTDSLYYNLLINKINYLRPNKDSIKKRCKDVRAVKVKSEHRIAITETTANYCLDLLELEKVYNSKK